MKTSSFILHKHILHIFYTNIFWFCRNAFRRQNWGLKIDAKIDAFFYQTLKVKVFHSLVFKNLTRTKFSKSIPGKSVPKTTIRIMFVVFSGFLGMPQSLFDLYLASHKIRKNSYKFASKHIPSQIDREGKYFCSVYDVSPPKMCFSFFWFPSAFCQSQIHYVYTFFAPF